jgi:glutaredoxin-related protein
MHLFISNSTVTTWKMQYVQENMGKLHRFKMLLLKGPSQCGKTVFAKHLFGREQTLMLTCQKGSDSLPNMREFSRSKHLAILFDEVTEKQVLGSKALLQSTIENVQLAQSQCGQHRYDVNVYGIAMILSSNDFTMEVGPTVSKEDAEWLKANIIVVEMQPGSFWYIVGTKRKNE